MFARFRTFCWQASHLLPPLLIGFFALPQHEPPSAITETAVVVAETAVIAPTQSEPSPYVPDERPPVVERAVHVIAPAQPPKTKPNAAVAPHLVTGPKITIDLHEHLVGGGAAIPDSPPH